MSTEKQMPTDFVRYSEFDPARVGHNSPESKAIPGKQGQFYQQIILNYNYGTDEKPDVKDLFIELPHVSSSGISEMAGKEGEKISYSMYVPLNIRDPKCELFIKKYSEMFNKTAAILEKNRVAVKLPAFKGEMSEMCGYKHPIYYPTDKVTGEKIIGRNPSMYVKLHKAGAGHLEEKTLFTDLKRNPIDWKLLYGVEMNMIPLVHVKKIYIGVKPSLQMEIVSAVVTRLIKKNTETRQSSTIDSWIQQNPDADEKLQEQIAKLNLDNQGGMTPSHNNGNNNNGNGNNNGHMSNISSQSSLQDFLTSGGNGSELRTPTIKLS